MDRVKRVNDFVVRFADIGYLAETNDVCSLFAMAVFRSGVPVSSKRVVPPYTEKTPPCCEIRVSDRCYLGRRGGCDFMVALTAKALQDDSEITRGGYLLYNSDHPLPKQWQQQEVTLLDIPLTSLAIGHFGEAGREKEIALGVLTRLFSIELSIVTDAITRTFAHQPQIAAQKNKALTLGYDYSTKHFSPGMCLLSIEKSRAARDSILLDGDSAAGLGALYGGATVAAWHPTPDTSSAVEQFHKYSNQYKGKENPQSPFTVIRAENELAAIGMIIGAAWNGARAFSSLSSAGLSVASGLLGLAQNKEIPLVLVDMQQPDGQQADILAAAYTSHRETGNILLFPCNPAECFTMTAQAFELAQQLRALVFIMNNPDLGGNIQTGDPLSWDDTDHQHIDINNKISSTSHSRLTETQDETWQRLIHTWDAAKQFTPEPHSAFRDPENQLGILFYGTTTHAAYEAIGRFAAKGIKINTMRLRGFPFSREVHDFIRDHQRIFLIEQNRDAQMKTLLIKETDIAPQKIESILSYDGTPVSVAFLEKQLARIL